MENANREIIGLQDAFPNTGRIESKGAGIEKLTDN